MVHSPLLDSFNPFATHPFTNNSGLNPEPPSPSVYPLLIPASFGSPNVESNHTLKSPSSPASLGTSSSMDSVYSEDEASLSRIHSPQPRRYPAALHSPISPPSRSRVFVPFRKDASSPDLILKKKSSTSVIGSINPSAK